MLCLNRSWIHNSYHCLPPDYLINFGGGKSGEEKSGGKIRIPLTPKSTPMLSSTVMFVYLANTLLYVCLYLHACLCVFSNNCCL